MIVRVEQQDIDPVSVNGAAHDANPIVRAVERATAGMPDLYNGEWVVGKMPIFDEESLRLGQHMPQLYVISQNDPLATDFYVLPPMAQAFLHQWFDGAPVTPTEFELPLQPARADEPGQLFGLPSSMEESIRGNLSRLAQEANREIDVETLRRGLAKLVREIGNEPSINEVRQTVAKLVKEGNREIDLGTVREGVAKLSAIGNTPVSTIGREISRILVTPIGPGARLSQAGSETE